MFVLFALSSAAPFASAATSTAANACFCYVDDKGASKTDGATDDPSCATLCAKNGTKDAGHQWATSFGQYPGANLRCWEKQTDCEKDLDGDISGPEGATIDGQWSYAQPAECLEGSHYCYSADTIKTYLQVEIGGTTSVVNFADYVGVVYQYLMGFSMTVAIVFLMIGGLRYVLGASSGDVTKAKKMMTNAVEGFVLLMFAYVILYTVNPQLLKLQVPKLPMLRTMVYSDGSDCATVLGLDTKDNGSSIEGDLSAADEDLFGENAWTKNGAVIKYDKSKENSECGTTAEILLGAGGSSVADGKTCEFQYCRPGTMCAPGKEKGECVACNEVGADNSGGVVPSDALCRSITLPNEMTQDGANGQVLKTYNYCGYSKDPFLALGEADVVLYGTCASLSLDCAEIRAAELATPGSGCPMYDGGQVKIADGGDTNLDSLVNSPNSWESLGQGGNPNIVDICAQNPCGVSGGCEYSISLGGVGGADCKAAGTAKAEAASEAASEAARIESYDNYGTQ